MLSSHVRKRIIEYMKKNKGKKLAISKIFADCGTNIHQTSDEDFDFFRENRVSIIENGRIKRMLIE